MPRRTAPAAAPSSRATYPAVASPLRPGFKQVRPSRSRRRPGLKDGPTRDAAALGGVLDFEPKGSAAAFVPVAFPDLVRHGEGRLEAAERKLAGPCNQLLAMCPVLVSATADAGGLAEDLQCTPGGRGFGCRWAVWCLSDGHAPDHVGCVAQVELLEAAACLPHEFGCGDSAPGDFAQQVGRAGKQGLLVVVPFLFL